MLVRGDQVEVSEYKEVIDGTGSRSLVKTPKEYGKFHQFGVDYEEFESGAGNYSTAIVEVSDGSIRNVPVDMIKAVK